MNLKKLLLSAPVLAAALAFAVVSVYAGQAFHKRQQSLKQRKLLWSSLREKIERRCRSFPGSAGIVIRDLSTGWEISYGKSVLFPAASIVKVPIMAACHKAEEEGRLSLWSELRLEEKDRTPGSGKLKTMSAGSSYTVERLIDLMIAESDNTATNMLIGRLTPGYINSFFSQQGLKSTNLARKMMDFSRRKQGVENYTSAGDMADIIERMYRGRCVSARASERCVSVLLKQKMKDRIPKKLPKDTRVAHKTGLERSVCHDVGVIFTSEGDFLVCVLTKSRSKGGFRMMKDFIAQVALEVYNAYRPAETASRSPQANKGG